MQNSLNSPILLPILLFVIGYEGRWAWKWYHSSRNPSEWTAKTLFVLLLIPSITLIGVYVYKLASEPSWKHANLLALCGTLPLLCVRALAHVSLTPEARRDRRKFTISNSTSAETGQEPRSERRQ